MNNNQAYHVDILLKKQGRQALYLDLVRPEEHIGLEIVDGFIDDVGDVLFVRHEGRSRTPELGLERQKGHVANLVTVLQEARVVGLRTTQE
jgi:hypothetical protein